jgi:ABC-type glycerol-3-phosphate transport system substrate-binding protein
MERKFLTIITIATLAAVLLTSCQKTTTTTAATNTTLTTTAATTTTATTYTISALKYQLLAAYPDYFWCDPDLYPVAQPGVEQQNAIAQFATIMAN